MRKLLLFFFALLTGVGGAWATDGSITLTTSNVDFLRHKGTSGLYVNNTSENATYLGTNVSPLVSIYQGGGNIQVSTFGLYTAGYTIKMLSGYTITSYVISVTPSTAQTFAVTGGTPDVTSLTASTAATITVSGVNAQSSTFTFSGTGGYNKITSIVVNYSYTTAPSMVQTMSDLVCADYSTCPTYTLTCTRSALYAESNILTTVHSVEAGGGTPVNANKKFAFIRNATTGDYYLYHVATGKFVNQDKSLSVTPSNPVKLYWTSDFSKPTFIKIGSNIVNVQESGSTEGGVILNAYGTADGGNSFAIEPTGGSTADLTNAYKIVNGWNTTFHIVGTDITHTSKLTYNSTIAMPIALSYCDYTYYSDSECNTEITTADDFYEDIYVTYTTNATCPITFSTTGSPVWYNIKTSRNYYVCKSGENLSATESPSLDDEYLWLFEGNPYSFKMYNKAATAYLTDANPTTSGTNGTFTAAGTGFTLYKNSNASAGEGHIAIAVTSQGYYTLLNTPGNTTVNFFYSKDVTQSNWSITNMGAAFFYPLKAKTVTYVLMYGETEIGRESKVATYGSAESQLPASLSNNGFMAYSYSPTTIDDETSTVTVTATWNGPFQYTATYDAGTAKWYTIGIHKYYEGNNYIWKYNGTDNVIPEAVATNAYASITDNHLFCFVGDPYTGFTIYNKAAGSGLKLYRSGDDAQVTMNATATLLLPKTSSVGLVSNGYFCLKPSDGKYINFVDVANGTLSGWDGDGNGSTCWVIAPSQYPYNFLNGFALDAPNGAVGTVDVDAPTWANAGSSKDYLAENPFYYAEAANRSLANGVLNALAGASNVTLSDGYYRIVSAVSRLNNTAAWCYNPSTDASHIVWSTAATTSEQKINSIFRLTESDGTWSIYSPNARKSIKEDSPVPGWKGQTATLGDDAGEITIASLGSAQYSFKVKNQSQCIAAQNSLIESGYIDTETTSGTLNCWNFTALGHSSTWYIVPVSSLEISLNSGGDEKYYATLCLPFDVAITDAYTNAYTLTMNGAKDGLTLSSAITEIPAGTPVLLRGTMNKTTLSLASDARVASNPLTTTALTGVFEDISVTANTDYFLGADAGVVGFYKWDDNTLKANRAYLTAGSLTPVKGFAINFDDADGIHAVEKGDLKADAGIYNLAGQRVTKAQKGIFIVNGKKVVK